MLATVCAAIAPLYANPEKGTLIDEVLFGMTVTVDQKQNGFCHVVTHYRYEGWMPVECLYFENAEQWQQEAELTVIAPFADLLSQPKVQGVCLTSVPRGGFVVPAGQPEKGWQPVSLPHGQTGWLAESYLQRRRTSADLSDPARLRQALCDTAKSYLGAQYRWGGKTPLGIDCSGLVSMAYMLNGIIIYRDAKLMDGFDLHAIPVSEVRPADLLFFPGHVAMYLGQGLFIHSTGHQGTEGCCIASFSPEDKRYREDLARSVQAAGSIF